MKKFLLFTMAAALALPAAGYAQGSLKIGTVDMNRAFKEYNKTKDSEKKINEAKDAAKKEYDDRAENYKKALDEINKLNQQLDSPALSADKKTSMAKERDEKIANIKNMEREINEFRQTRERQLQEQAMRMRENIVKEITDVIMERVKSNSYDLVFDKTGPSMNGVNVVIYAKESYDFTTDIITALNERPVTTTTEKPATSPASTATTTTTSPATTPKKP
jgi:outer membrane protein